MLVFKPTRLAWVALTVMVVVLAGGVSPAHANLVIVPTFDTSITSDPNSAAMKSAIQAAISQIEANIKNPITVSIDFKSVNTGLGESSTGINDISYTQYLSDLTTRQTRSANDNIALAHLPTGPNNPATNDPNLILTLPLLRALGETSLGDNGGSFDSTISLNTSLMNLSRTGTQDPDKYDMQSVATHEIDEVLGTGGSGSTLGQGESEAGSLDLFRYSANGVRSYTTDSSATAYFSIDGGATKLTGFNQAGGGSDYADWASGPTPQVQDAFGTPGAQPNLGTNELTAFDVVGYDLASVPEPASCGVLLIGVGGLLLRPRRRIHI